MSRRLGASLEFHIRHAHDILALEELGDIRPDGVVEEDWKKYRDVLALASQQAADILVGIRDRAIDLLAATVRVTSKSNRKSALNSWDAWFEFALPGGGRKAPVGWIGAMIGTDLTHGDMLIAYILAKGDEQRQMRVLQTLRELGIALPDDVHRLVEGNAAPVYIEPLTPQIDADKLTSTALAAIKKVASRISIFGEAA